MRSFELGVLLLPSLEQARPPPPLLRSVSVLFVQGVHVNNLTAVTFQCLLLQVESWLVLQEIQLTHMFLCTMHPCAGAMLFDSNMMMLSVVVLVFK